MGRHNFNREQKTRSQPLAQPLARSVVQAPYPTNSSEIKAIATLTLRELLRGHDVAEFQAQQYAADMIDFLAGVAMDVTQEIGVRRQCANDVLNRAYGTPATKQRVEITDMTTQGHSGVTIAQEIEAIRLTTALQEQINELVMRGIPPEAWPEDIRLAAGNMIASFTSDGMT